MGIDLAVEQAGLPFRAIVSVCLSKWQVYGQERVGVLWGFFSPFIVCFPVP